MEILKAKAWAPGTCGELVEGAIGESTFLITCPIDMGSTIEISQSGEGFPKEFSKTAKGIELVASKLGLPLQDLSFTRDSLLPPGKGMASSTADIAAALLATARLGGKELTAEELATLSLSIEPSDGIMFEGVVLFDYKEGKWFEELGEAPPLNILVVDPSGVVDTINFYQGERFKECNLRKEKRVKIALRLVKEGLREGDIEKIGRGVTESALANQELLPKPDLPKVLEWAKEVKALGVNVAHSGTVMGILLAEDGFLPEEIMIYLKKKKPEW
ncbi:MAG: GHMP kinase, partial [Bacillota bacterium]